MAKLPKNLQSVSEFFERLPGIGQKTANRLAFYLLRMPERDLIEFAENLKTLKSKTKRCSICLNLTEAEVCAICDDSQRDHSIITVVEDVVDLLSFETGNIYQGVYHVLHGRIDPLNNIGPEDIYIDHLLKRIQEPKFPLKEIILATNPDMEGEATAMYLRNKISELAAAVIEDGLIANDKEALKITRLGYGLPMGGNLEYADYMTLKKSMENRSSYNK